MVQNKTQDTGCTNLFQDQVSNMQVQQGNSIAIQTTNNITYNSAIEESDSSQKTNVITYGQNITFTNHFIGRDCEIQEVLEKLRTSKRILIKGLGGIGKTTVMQKIYHILLDKIKKENLDMQIGYFDYEISTAYTIYKALGFEKTNDKAVDLELAAKALQDYSNKKDTVIFIDNVPADRHKELHELDCYSCWIILTSRQQEYTSYDTVDIGRLGLEDCIRLFQKESRYQGNTADLENLIENMIGRHTLTVKLAARILRKEHWPVEVLINKLEDTGFDINYKDEGEEKNLLLQYKKLYSVSELSESEVRVLESFSLVRHAKLHEAFCIRILEEDEFSCLNELYEKGWLEYEQTNASYSIHPVFAELISEIREISLDDHRMLYHFIDQLTKNVKETEMLQKQDYLAAMISFARYIPLHGSHCREISNLLINCAGVALVFAEYHGAYAILKRIGESDENYIKAQLKLVDIYVSQSRFQQADSIFRCLSSKIKEDSTQFIDYTIDYAIFKEKSAKSETDRREAVCSLEKMISLEMDDMHRSCIYNCLGGFYTNLSPDVSNFKKSLDYHKQAQQIREKYKEDYPMDLARTYNNMANNYYYLARAGEQPDENLCKAEAFYKKSLELRRLVLNDRHPDIARIYVNLGNVYLEYGRFEEALQFMENGLKIRREVLGEHAKETGLTWRNMIKVYLKRNDRQKAAECRERSEKIYASLYGENSDTYQELKKQNEKIFLCQ